jgi:signal transduction histidine kinase
MHSSRTSPAATRPSTGLISLLTVSVAAGLGALAADLSARGARPLPVALEFAALFAAAGAFRLAWRAGAASDAASRTASGAPPLSAQRANPPQSPSRPPPASRASSPDRARTPSEPQLGPQPQPQPRPPWQLQPMPMPAPAPSDDPYAGARRAFVNLARRIQAAVNRQLRELRELEARHGGDPEVFGDLLQVDHATALIGRLADSLAVLGGDRPTRRWQRPIPLVSVLRGAMSRITDYRRVEIGPLPEGIAVDGGAVEALVHALAELLDNATRYSPPDTRVRLGARTVEGGCVVEVVDAGVGLTPGTAKRAESVLRTHDFGLELASLGETPRLGLAVVGRLARATGFEVSLHRADGGGVRAETLLPARLLRDLPDTDLVPAIPEQRPHSHRAGEVQRTTGAASSTVVGTTAHGLPQRRRVVPDGGKRAQNPGKSVANGTPETKNGAPGTQRATPGGSGTAPAPGLWLAAFQAGLRGESGGGADQGDGRTTA